jgi:UDP-N-acetylmuramyl pentapeptide phosphotransferase/UDP-N-acetylglucosamine-1-phosphate transferase/protein involved in polysaccharide export with SLBB domain
VKNTLNYLINYYQIPQEYWYALFFVIAWLLSYVSFPEIINISNEKKLLATPSDRCSHTKETPTLGGVGIFIGFILSFSLFGSVFPNMQSYSLIVSLVALFFLGLKDDILNLSAKTKFLVQLAVVFMLIISSNVTVTNLYGLFGIHQLNQTFSIALTVFIFILIINAYNLIDGIDGLAGTIAVCFLTFISLFFYAVNVISMCVISLTLLGSIIAFLQFNFSIKNKIFMGDTGSMIVGFLLAFLMINFLNLKDFEIGSFSYTVNPVLMISLLFYPLLDTARIFFIRVFIYKTNPFKADRNHLHHKLLDLNFKHWHVSVFVGAATLFLGTLSLLINGLNIHFQLLIILIMGTLIFSFPQLIHKSKKHHFGFMKSGALILCAFLTITMMLQSCTTKKDILYLQSPSKNTFESNKFISQNIETNDILSVRISSIDNDASKIYNIDLLEGGPAPLQGEILKLKSYLVNDEGFITLPVLGILKVNDKTCAELENFLKLKLIQDGQLKDPIVVVRVLNSKVTILGEVRNPGTFSFSEKNLSLLQTIGLAGDLTINGKREDVVLIRQENNIKTIYHVDLTSKDWIDSELYYIKQNDVIIVNPNNAKIKSAGIIGNAGTLVGVISLLLTAAILIKN